MRNVVKLESEKELLLTSISSRELILRHHELSDIKVKKDKNNKIVSIKIDNYKIKINDILYVQIFDYNKVPFKVLNIVKRKDKTSYSLTSTILTKAAKWIMPMLRNKSQTYTSMKYNTWFINCYVGTKDEGYLPYIYLVYRYSGNSEYQHFEEELKNHSLFDRLIDLDKFHVMYVFKMTNKHKKIFELFKHGKYSQFPDEYKKQILNFVINPIEYPNLADIKKTIVYGVLYKTELQRKRIESLINFNSDIRVKAILPENIDLLSIPDESKEVYTGDIEMANINAIQEEGLKNFDDIN